MGYIFPLYISIYLNFRVHMYNQFYFQNAVECFMNALKLMPSPATGGHDAGVLLRRRDQTHQI